MGEDWINFLFEQGLEERYGDELFGLFVDAFEPVLFFDEQRPELLFHHLGAGSGLVEMLD